MRHITRCDSIQCHLFQNKWNFFKYDLDTYVIMHKVIKGKNRVVRVIIPFKYTTDHAKVGSTSVKGPSSLMWMLTEKSTHKLKSARRLRHIAPWIPVTSIAAAKRAMALLIQEEPSKQTRTMLSQLTSSQKPVWFFSNSARKFAVGALQLDPTWPNVTTYPNFAVAVVYVVQNSNLTSNVKQQLLLHDK